MIIFCIGMSISCDEVDDLKNCNHCDDDSPFSTVDSGTCYATLSECERNESGNCVLCQ